MASTRRQYGHRHHLSSSSADLPLLTLTPDNPEFFEDHPRFPADVPSPYFCRILDQTRFIPPSPRYDGEVSKAGIKLQSPVRQSYLTFLLATLTLLWCVMTALYVYNATLERPIKIFLFSNNRYTLAIVSAMSQISMFLVGELVQATFERTRWALASKNGLSLISFLGMSRATSLFGVARLFFYGGNHWNAQRFVNFPNV